jgi:hypothetical protein
VKGWGFGMIVTWWLGVFGQAIVSGVRLCVGEVLFDSEEDAVLQ